MSFTNAASQRVGIGPTVLLSPSFGSRAGEPSKMQTLFSQSVQLFNSITATILSKQLVERFGGSGSMLGRWKSGLNIYIYIYIYIYIIAPPPAALGSWGLLGGI